MVSCQICHRKPEKGQERETVLKFEELFEKWKGGEPTKQIQTEHDEKTFEALV